MVDKKKESVDKIIQSIGGEKILTRSIIVQLAFASS